MDRMDFIFGVLITLMALCLGVTTYFHYKEREEIRTCIVEGCQIEEYDRGLFGDGIKFCRCPNEKPFELKGY